MSGILLALMVIAREVRGDYLDGFFVFIPLLFYAIVVDIMALAALIKYLRED